jgi:hypothetical protein
MKNCELLVLGQSKFGYSTLEGTLYLEFDLKNPADYEKGRQIIDVLVRGKASTPEELKIELEKISPIIEPIKTNSHENEKRTGKIKAFENLKPTIPRVASFATGALGIAGFIPSVKEIGDNLKDGNNKEALAETAAVISGGSCFTTVVETLLPWILSSPLGAITGLAGASAVSYSCAKIASDSVEMLGNLKPNETPLLTASKLMQK